MDRYEVQCRVGQGAYGTVVRARHRPSGQTVAIKKMSTARSPLLAIRELCALRNLHHKHILSLIDCFCSSDTLSLVTEFVPFHLNDIILDTRRPKDDSFIRYFYEQILSAVAHMHSVGIMHRDLKPENILVTPGLSIRVADLGQACLYFPEDESKEYEENVATRWYRAPELLFGSRRYSPSVDIWALGCVLSEFVTGCPLLQGRSDIEQMSKVFALLGTPNDSTWPSWPSMPDAGKLIFDETQPLTNWSTVVPGASPEFVAFLKLHLRLDAKQRSSAKELLQCEWIQGPHPRPFYRMLKRNRSLSRRQPLLDRR